ncbi:hypothetical protein A9G11_09180 [Gilliamella sp. wkB108]|uniref:hypothetical protein n=1 Tax=Gilliamella sp. wkB108 TaxID=3120256 RepID=UPI00080E413D|nr:hypothetical protein [Gilliamella apicola]OCG21098.1 hypothetical protein A9G11_09180 [Gilliamella apicola]
MLGWSVSIKNETKDQTIAYWVTTKNPHEWIKSLIEQGETSYESGQNEYSQTHRTTAKSIRKFFWHAKYNISNLDIHELVRFDMKVINLSDDDDIIVISTLDQS